MTSIYVLQCEQNKIYVGKSKDPIERVTQHFYNNGSQWTKKYKPLHVLEIIPDMTDFDEDKYTKIYMYRHGIQNVRGGSYTSVQLLDYQIRAIQHELAAIGDSCYTCKEYGHFAADCPKNKPQKKRRRMTKKSVIKNNRELFGDLFT
jgi:hypothetical protein